jgi:Radical SAM superfamily/Iron-sulfur cluster-binding domain
MKLPVFLERFTHPSIPPMICRMIFDEICVLANGDIVCSCHDSSGKQVYGNVYRDRIADVYNGPLYQELRGWQLTTKPDAWCPVLQADCAGRISRATSRDGLTGRVVRKLQLEPTSYCNLKCPACPVTHFHTDPSFRDDRANILPLDVMLNVVEQLPDLELILFYDYGESFLHKDAIPFLQTVRRQRPDILLHTSTNGLALNPKKIEALAAEPLIDLIVFSIDGAWLESYRRYRVNGNLQRALANMEGLVRACERAGTADRVQIVWQYILFEWNDSDEELAEARRRAAEIGVPLKWVFTHTEGASKRYTAGSDAAARLYAGETAERLYGDVYSGLNAEMRVEELRDHEGIAAGRYLARLSLDRGPLTGLAGSRTACLLTVENLSPSAWRTDGGRRYSIGVRLRSHTGRVLHELHGMPVPLAVSPPGGKETVLLEISLPDTPGLYELFVDVVEEDVCWFSDRGSPPLVCEIQVLAGVTRAWQYEVLVERTYLALLGRKPEPEAVSHWQQVLESGSRLEQLLAEVCQASAPEQGRRLEKRLRRLRKKLLADIEAMAAA